MIRKLHSRSWPPLATPRRCRARSEPPLSSRGGFKGGWGAITAGATAAFGFYDTRA